MAIRKFLWATAALASPLAVQAQPVSGLYVGAGAGANWGDATDLRQNGSMTAGLRSAGFPANNGRTTFQTGYVGVVSLGYGFGNGLRLEGEIGYRNNDTNGISGFGPLVNSGRIPGTNGTRHSGSFMVNALYDFHIPAAPWVMPYVGAGAGVALTGYTGNASRFTVPGTLVRTDYNGDVAVFAYQAIAGLAFPIASVPGLAVTAEYRYFATTEVKYSSTASFAPTGRQLATGSITVDNGNHSALLGLRYAFNAPRPAPVVVAPVAPAPAPARTYLVFFDWDRADLTDRARQIIADAAQNARTVNSTRIEVSGHADRTGTAQYNQRLSVRRAEAVATELVRRGIARNEITIQGFGFDRPLVPTAMGVREPQNRRVEIILH
ncbi:OmpA family protein [Roseococcus sp. XZZS9]|uniref:OmpA family protein n=2 Tax=Roseococcus pinisoli TaxID=2835040 RepID=A0ABS5QJH1_9PROT|nr:OmpA family protein [Roseococcus pinisoli]MBS7813801.1 OmpA family protein [Roseococcus pinisoli]